MRVGSAPDSWGVWFPNDPKQVPWTVFLDELAEAGYEWVELGPYGFLPTDAAQLSDEVSRRGLSISGGTVGVELHQSAHFVEARNAVRKVAQLTHAVGAHYLVLLPDGDGDVDWKHLVRSTNELGKMTKEDFDITLVFHPHADGYVEKQPEVERLLDDTNPDYVQLCLDTGHIAYGGGDSLALIAKYPTRIGYVHLKQVDPVVLAEARALGLTFGQAVPRGVCPEPPAGTPSFADLYTALKPFEPDLFTIVEQDMYPCPPDKPLPIARRTRAYLRQVGFG